VGSVAEFGAVRPVFHWTVLVEALHPEQIAVQFHHLLASGPPVQTIHVLRDQGEFRDPAFHLHQSAMTGIRLGLPHPLLPPSVPFPNQLGIAPKSFRRRQVFRPL
jgi:hypothetical protein